MDQVTFGGVLTCTSHPCLSGIAPLGHRILSDLPWQRPCGEGWSTAQVQRQFYEGTWKKMLEFDLNCGKRMVLILFIFFRSLFPFHPQDSKCVFIFHLSAWHSTLGDVFKLIVHKYSN